MYTNSLRGGSWHSWIFYTNEIIFASRNHDECRLKFVAFVFQHAQIFCVAFAISHKYFLSLATFSTDNSIQSSSMHDLEAKALFCPRNKHGRDCGKDVRRYRLHFQVLFKLEKIRISIYTV